MISFATWPAQGGQPCSPVRGLCPCVLTEGGGGRSTQSQMTLGIKGHSAAFTSGSLSRTVVVSI